jgi:two-component system, sensor histidine kinase
MKVDQESDRLKALDEYEILDTIPEQEFDELTRLAAEICDVPMSEINLIDKTRQWTKSSYGIESAGSGTDREQSVCQYTIYGTSVLEVKDLTKDKRFAAISAVTDSPGLRYYLGAPLVTSHGHAIGALCVLDVKTRSLGNRQKRQLKLLADEVMARLELKKKNRELEQSNKHRVDLMKMLSHDMRSPLNGIIGMGSLLRDSLEHSENIEMVSIIEQSALQLNQMLDEILSYSLIESGRFELNPEKFEVGDVVRSMDRLYRPVALSKKIDLIFDNSAVCEVRLDRNKFEQIFGNLLSNALKFTRPEGHVETVIGIDQSGSSSVLTLKVRDSGIGMDEEQLSGLFAGEGKERQGTSGEKSTGLGLSIIKYFVELHGGQIRVNSRSGEGTEFVVTLPVEID